MLFAYKKDLVLNYIYYALGIIAPGLFSFALIPFIVRLFGADLYAEYSMCFSLISIVNTFFYGWVGQSYLRFYTKDYKNFESISYRLLFISLVAGLLIYLPLQLYIVDVNAGYLLILVPVFFLNGLYAYALIQQHTRQRAKQVTFSETLRSVVLFTIPLLFYIMLQNNAGLTVLLFALTCAYLLPLVFVLKPKMPPLTFSIPDNDKKTAKIIKRYGFPLSVFLSVSLALAVSDRFLINYIIGSTASGNYAALYDVFNKGITLACAPVIFTFFPHIIKEFNSGNKKAAYQSLKKALLLELIFFVSGFILLYFFSDYLLGFLFTDKHIPDGYTNLSYILYIGVFISQFGILAHKPLEMKRQTWLLALGVVLAFLLNLITNYFLLTKYKDVMIAGYTTVGASVFYLLYVCFFVFKLHLPHKVKPLEAVLK